MRVAIYTTDRTALTISAMSGTDVMDLIDALHAGETWLTITLDGRTTTHVNARNIIRVDIDE